MGGQTSKSMSEDQQLFEQAQEVLKDSEFEKALDFLTSAISIKPTGKYFHAKAKIYKKLKEYPDALANFDNAIKYDDTNVEFYVDRAEFQSKILQQYANALLDYSKAIELKKNDPALYSARAMIFANLGKFHHAFEDQQKAIQLNPTNAYHRFNQAVTRYKMGDYAGAVKDAEEALRIEPQNSLFKKTVNQLKVELEIEVVKHFNRKSTPDVFFKTKNKKLEEEAEIEIESPKTRAKRNSLPNALKTTVSALK